MSSESVAAKHDMETNASAASKEGQIVELNNRLKTDFMAHCFSFLHEDEDARQCIQIVWNRYLECVGDVAMLAAFFDTLPYHLKVSVLPRYQQEIIQWCEKTFHVRSQALLCSTYYSETFQRVIRYALTNVQYKKAVIYIPMDFDPNLRIDLAASISNIRFEQIPNKTKLEDLIDVERLEELIRRDASDTLSYPFMVIANAGSPLLGRCDHLKKIKALCEQYEIWLHVIGDLLGSLPLVSSLDDDVNISCDSLTMDIMKLFGIQNLPYLTFFLRSAGDGHVTAETSPVVKSHPLDEFILHSPSISFLSVWSISQRCSKESILHHMKQSFEMVALLLNRLRQIESIRILNDEDDGETNKYERICMGSAPHEPLPKSIVIFRFQAEETTDEATSIDNLTGYVDLLNLWLFDKLAQQHPKINLELLKSVHFQQPRPTTTTGTATPAHALRFAPLEHLLDVLESDDVQSFADDVERFSDILFATLTARASLGARVAAHENLAAVPLPNWAGIGAIRYIPSTVNRSDMNATATYEINTIQAELARQLQTNDSAFSLGGGTEGDSMLYLRLGMIRRREDLDVLLNKISQMGKDTETSLKYIEDMAQKIKMGIEKAQKDLEDENLQLLAQEGLLRQLPLVSNIMSWWSPAASTLPLAMKGRSFDLNSGQVESTEETYVHRMQIKKQPLQAAMHETSAVPTADHPPE